MEFLCMTIIGAKDFQKIIEDKKLQTFLDEEFKLIVNNSIQQIGSKIFEYISYLY